MDPNLPSYKPKKIKAYNMPTYHNIKERNHNNNSNNTKLKEG
jgi:hypothetical protein